MNDLSSHVVPQFAPDSPILSQDSKIGISVVIPVREDDANLSACLQSVARYAEVIVVDSGHHESTERLACAAGAVYRAFTFTPPYPKKRNWLLDNHPPQHDWVLFLDADERITPEFTAALEARLKELCIEEHPPVGFWLNYQNYFMGRALKYGLGQRKLALINQHAGRYERIDDPGWTMLDMEIHEHPVLQGRVDELRPLIDHRDFRPVASFVDKHLEYARWEAGRVQQLLSSTGESRDADGAKRQQLSFRQRVKYRLITFAVFPFVYFLYVYIFRLGFLDGKAGLNYAMLKANYFATIYLLLKDHQG